MIWFMSGLILKDIIIVFGSGLTMSKIKHCVGIIKMSRLCFVCLSVCLC